MLILTLPVVMPVLKALNVDMIWFGVVAVLIIQMGILSPPVGLNVFIVKGIVPDVPMYTIFRGIWPFWYAMGLLIVLLLIFPQLALFLPNTMFGRCIRCFATNGGSTCTTRTHHGSTPPADC